MCTKFIGDEYGILLIGYCVLWNDFNLEKSFLLYALLPSTIILYAADGRWTDGRSTKIHRESPPFSACCCLLLLFSPHLTINIIRPLYQLYPTID